MSEPPVQLFAIHTGTLIEIFYGLAIASGIEHVGSRLFDTQPPKDLLAFSVMSSAAFLIAISDWIIYTLVLSTKPYKGIARLLCDISIITLIFFLFEGAEAPALYSTLLAIYFSLGAVYFLLFIREHEIPKEVWKFFYLQAVGAILCGISALLLKRVPALDHISLILIAVSCIFWGLANLHEAHVALRVVSSSSARESQRTKG